MNFEAIDLFCGAGGATTGLKQAIYNNNYLCKVIAAIDIDEYAIKSYKANHPEVECFVEDIRNFKLYKLPKYSNDVIKVLWVSAECTNFSKAKGNKKRDNNSRSLSEYIYRYIEYLKPDYILIENVREFLNWGKLDRNGKPINNLKGSSYLKWVNKIKSFGYNYDWKILDSADYEAYTSRKRYFGCFAKKGMPIAFPEILNAKQKSVKDVLNFDDEGNNIFQRKKPLSEKTLKRIYMGLIRYLGNEFLFSYYKPITVDSIDKPCKTITTVNKIAKVKPIILKSYESKKRINKNDNETLKKIKTFMYMQDIIEIKMRMLTIYEYLKIQGFPDNYILIGTQSQQLRFIGNSVVPVIPKIWLESINNKILKN